MKVVLTAEEVKQNIGKFNLQQVKVTEVTFGVGNQIHLAVEVQAWLLKLSGLITVQVLKLDDTEIGFKLIEAQVQGISVKSLVEEVGKQVPYLTASPEFGTETLVYKLPDVVPVIILDIQTTESGGTTFLVANLGLK